MAKKLVEILVKKKSYILNIFMDEKMEATKKLGEKNLETKNVMKKNKISRKFRKWVLFLAK